jgi:hypothetical protein
MKFRNENVCRDLQAAYASEMDQGQDLSVFCVSNTWYDKYHTLAGNRGLLTDSQIPALRQYCRTLFVDAQLAEVRQYLRCEMPEVLTSLGLWANAALRQQILAASIVGSADMLKVKDCQKEVSHCLTE